MSFNIIRNDITKLKVDRVFEVTPALFEANQMSEYYRQSMLLAKKKRLKSIAFTFDLSQTYKSTKVIQTAITVIKDFLADNDMQIYLAIQGKTDFRIDDSLFLKVKSFIDERMGKSDNRKFGKMTCAAPTMCADGYAKRKTKKRSLSELINKKVETFSQMLLRLIDEKGMTDVEVYKRANIDRKLFSKIRKKDYTPKKVTIIALAIAMRLNMDETEDLLRRAGFAFSECNKFDIIIEYFIENDIYDIFEINETLFAFEQPLLGA